MPWEEGWISGRTKRERKARSGIFDMEGGYLTQLGGELMNRYRLLTSK